MEKTIIIISPKDELKYGLSPDQFAAAKKHLYEKIDSETCKTVVFGLPIDVTVVGPGKVEHVQLNGRDLISMLNKPQEDR